MGILKCKRCGNEQDDSVKCCHVCGAFMEGPATHNITGRRGYRGADGMFYESEERYRQAGSPSEETADRREQSWTAALYDSLWFILKVLLVVAVVAACILLRVGFDKWYFNWLTK